MSWPVVQIGDVSEIVTGKTPSTADEANFGGDIPFVTPAELDCEGVITVTPRTLTDIGATNIRLVPQNSILVGCIGTLGKVGMAGRQLATNQQINAIVFDEAKIWPRFGFYAAQRLRPEMERVAPATTLKIISKSKFSAFTIPLPPLEEQKRIAGILDQADAPRRLRTHALDKLNALGQAIFHEMFGDSQKYVMRPLIELGSILTGSTPSTSNPEFFDGKIPFITPGDLEGRTVPTRYLTQAGAMASRTVSTGATFVCCIGTVGKMGMAKEASAFNQQINAVEWGTEVLPIFGYYAMQQIRQEIIHLGKGAATTLPILKKSSFQKLKVPVAHLEDQQVFSNRIAYINSLQKSGTNAIGNAEILFASLQHRAFRGEL